jgi:hypothetical protein
VATNFGWSPGDSVSHMATLLSHLALLGSAVNELAKMVALPDRFHYNSLLRFSQHRVGCWKDGVVMRVKPIGMLLMILAGWMNRHQQDVTTYLKEENKILQQKLLNFYRRA